MDRKIIHFPATSAAPSTSPSTDAELERALFLAEAELGWTTATVPQATEVTARAVY